MNPCCERPLRHALRLAVLGLLPLSAACEPGAPLGPQEEAGPDARPPALSPLVVPPPGSEPNFAVALDGLGDFVDMSPAPIGTPASITVEAWVKLAETDRLQFLITLTVNDLVDGLSLWVGPTNKLLFTAAAGLATNATAVGTTSLEADRWYHVAGVYDHAAGVLRVFVDGVEDGSVSYTGGINYNPFRDLRLGTQFKTTNRNSRFLNGALDEVRIWDFARTAEEIAADMSFEIEPTTGLVGYWRMNEGEGRTAEDLSGGDNTGALFSDATWVEATWRQQPVLEVPIDVLPWQSRNFIVTFRFIVAVAVLSTEDFDAARDVDRASLTFGRSGDESTLLTRPRGRRGAARPLCRGHDVNRDGRRDLVCLFAQRATGLRPEDTEAILKGQTADGMDIVGRDEVIVWSPGRWWR